MESNGDVKKSRLHLGDIGNTHVQMSSDPEEDMKCIKFKVDELLEGTLECQAKFNVVSEQRRRKLKHELNLKKLKEDITKSDAHHHQDMAALKAKDEVLKTKDEEMKKMKEDLEAKEMAALKAKNEEMKAKDEVKAKDEEMRAKDEEMRAKDEEMRKMKADLEAANRAKEMDKASLKVKDELLEDMAAGVKNSDMNQVAGAAFRAMWIKMERLKNEQDQMEQEKNAALRGKQMALAQRDDAEMRFQDSEMRFNAHLDDMCLLLKR